MDDNDDTNKLGERFHLPPPPDDKSVAFDINAAWELVIKAWKTGWAADSEIASIEVQLEFYRKRYFDDGWTDNKFDWQWDWYKAKIIHDRNVDFVRNRKTYNEDVRKMWMEWTERQYSHFGQLSLEALRSMILVNGAAILAALAVLSGQITSPPWQVVLVAKCTIITSVISILLMAAGHSMLFLRVNDLASSIRGSLNGNMRHRRLYAIGRYMRRYHNRFLPKVNFALFGSIVVFGLNALACSIILIFC